MKKLLLASTLLVGTAGMAAADVSVSGSGGMGVIFNGTWWWLHYDADVDFAMTGETDGGLMFGASTGINSSATSGGGTTTSIDTPTVWVSHDMYGTLSVGSVDTAPVAAFGGIADIGYSGLGVDDLAETQWSADNADVLYTNTFGMVSFAASYDTASSDFGFGGKVDFADYYVGLAYFNDGNDELSFKAGGTFGEFGVNVLYIYDLTASIYSAGIDASYTTGAVTVSAAYGTSNGTSSGYGLGVSYDLGGGATVDAGVANVSGTTYADFGINMTF